MATILILILILFLFHKIFDLRNLTNPFVSYFVYYTFFVYGGLIAYQLIYYKNEDFHIIQLSISLVLYGYISTFIIGVIADQLLFKGRYIHRDKIEIFESKYLLENLFLFLFSIFLFILFLYLSGFNPLKASDHGLERVSQQAGYGYIKILCLTFTYASVPPLLFNKRIPLALKITIFSLGCMIFLGFGFRAQLIKFLLIIFLIFAFLRTKEIKISTFLTYGVVLYFIMVVLGVLRSNVDADIIDLINAKLFWRPFVTFNNMNSVLEIFVNGQESFLFGKSILYDLSTLIPGTSGVGSSLTYYNEITDSMQSKGTITPTIIAVVYSNFGLVGVILLLPLIPLFLLFIAHRWQVAKSISIERLNLFIFISLALWGIAIAGIFLPLLYHIVPFYVIYILKVGFRSLFIKLN